MENETQFQPVRARQRLHELLDQADYELIHSRDNGRPERFPTLEVIENWLVAQCQGEPYLNNYYETIRALESEYGNGLAPRARNHNGSFEILKAEAIRRDKAIKQLLNDSGIMRIDKRPGSGQATLEIHRTDPYEFLIPYIIERLSEGNNIVSIVDGEKNMRKSTSIIWLLKEISGMSFTLGGESYKIPPYDLRTCVHWDPETLMDEIEKEPPRGTSFILDDWEQSANSKSHQSTENIISSDLVQTVRDRQYSLYMTTISIKNIDAQAREGITEYLHSTGETGVFEIGRPNFNKGQVETITYFSKQDPSLRVEGIPVLAQYRSVMFPHLDKESHTLYNEAKSQAFRRIRQDQGRLLRARRLDKDSVELKARNKAEMQKLREQQILDRKEEQDLKRMGRIRRGKEIYQAKQEGLTIREIKDKFGITAQSIPALIEFYLRYRKEIDKDQGIDAPSESRSFKETKGGDKHR